MIGNTYLVFAQPCSCTEFLNLVKQSDGMIGAYLVILFDFRPSFLT